MTHLRLVSNAAEAPAGLALRVAVATRDGERVDAHFGSARKFSIFEVSRERSSLVETAVWDDLSDESGTHDKEVDRIGPKVAALKGADLLFCLAIGGPAAAKVIASRIHPIKLSEPESIQSVIARVQGFLTASDPPPWMRKVLLAKTPRSMDFLDEEQ
jgi:nitrogen fixation protein NifX